jgi:hypothetical protein
MKNIWGSVAAAASLIVVASFISREAEGQSLADKISAARDGKVRLSFAAKKDICGFGTSISRGGNNRFSWSSDDSPDVVYDEECSHSPVRIVMTVTGGRVQKLRTYVGGRWRTPETPTTDLGSVSTRDAAGFLLSLASSEDSHVGSEAILPVTLADSVTAWPQLIKLVRDESLPLKTRKQALFWVGQAAGDAVAPDRSMRGHETDEEEVKKQAVFALSQRRNGEAVPALIQVARNNRDPSVRRTALFWLGQTIDPRAVSLFEEILRSN